MHVYHTRRTFYFIAQIFNYVIRYLLQYCSELTYFFIFYGITDFILIQRDIMLIELIVN